MLVDDTASLRLFGAQVLRFEDVWLRDVVAGSGNGSVSTSSTCPTHCFAG